MTNIACCVYGAILQLQALGIFVHLPIYHHCPFLNLLLCLHFPSHSTHYFKNKQISLIKSNIVRID